jgi:hypothetical protein
MEVDLVDAIAEPVVRAQPRRVGVGFEAPADRLLRARQPADVLELALRP